MLCYSSFEINEDIVQIQPMLEVLFTQDSKVITRSVARLPALNLVCSSAIISLAWG